MFYVNLHCTYLDSDILSRCACKIVRTPMWENKRKLAHYLFYLVIWSGLCDSKLAYLEYFKHSGFRIRELIEQQPA